MIEYTFRGFESILLRASLTTIFTNASLLLPRLPNVICTDGLLIQGTDARANESSLTGESEPVKIHAGRPFLLSGSSLVEGQAKYLVTAVGPYSEWGKILTELNDDRPDTPLQVSSGLKSKHSGPLAFTTFLFTFDFQLSH